MKPIVLISIALLVSASAGCTRVESGSVYVRGDYTVVSADAATSGTVTVDASRDTQASPWAAIFSLLSNLWR
jgi:hypothetical protein